MMNNVDKLLLAGFTQGNNIGYYHKNRDDIPEEQGVYAIVRPADTSPNFLERGTGGFFKGENPNVSISELQANWVEDTCILYLGRATGKKGLKQRLSEYFSFGRGNKVGHKGGRYIWQLSDANDFIVYCKPTPGQNPDTVETELINDFKLYHNGRRPFANLNK